MARKPKDRSSKESKFRVLVKRYNLLGDVSYTVLNRFTDSDIEKLKKDPDVISWRYVADSEEIS
jgi:hypothetical protein